MKRKSPLAALATWLTVALASTQPAAAADRATGAIEGRVTNIGSGEYVEKARVTVEGTSLEAFTDSSGQYRLTHVPSGGANVSVFFTGLARQSEAVHVVPGDTIRRDFDLSEDGSIVRLSAYVVGARREMDAAAMAINEQRFSPNMKNVVTVEEFGMVAEGNVAEVLKFMPGVTVDYAAGDASTISIGGVPSDYVPVTIGGFALATASSSSTSRQVQFEQVAINNIARIEVLHSPTPESSGAALAGSVNLITRSAFERSRPIFNYNTYVMARDHERSLRKTPGPFEKSTYKIDPGFDFNYIRPVNERFGYTLSGGYNSQYSPQDRLLLQWRGIQQPTNGNAFPDTTPDKPYLTTISANYGQKTVKRTNIGTTIDYKLTGNDSVSLSLLYTDFENAFENRNLMFLINRVLPGGFDTTFTHSEPGHGEVRLNQGASRKRTISYMPTLAYRHDGMIWKAEAGTGHSSSRNYYTNHEDGRMDGALSRRTGVTVLFDDISGIRPRTVTVTDGATGAVVDPGRLDNYSFTRVVGSEISSSDTKRSAFVNAGRSFDLGGVAAALKGGLDVIQQKRDVRRTTRAYPFVGADGRGTTTPTHPLGSDDSPAMLINEGVSQRPGPYGFGPIQWVSPAKAFNLFQSHPEYFTSNPNNEYRSGVSGSQFAEETVSSAYLRGDLAFLERRLKFVGGVRAEQTNVKAEGPLTDPTLNFQRDAGGNVILGPTGNPLLIVPTSDALGVSQLTFIERGQRSSKEYLRLFPSLNVGYNLRENLILRAAYYQSLGRPNFNQYAGGVTLPNTENLPSPGNRIIVNNAGIKAWRADTFKLRLEYYFDAIGHFSVSAFRRDYENFFGSTRVEATPALLSLYGIDAGTYGDYEVQTQYNLGSTVHTYGMDFDYKQVLSFLPHWARGVQVFANASTTRVTGEESQQFMGYIPRSGNLGVSLTRDKYNLRMNWNVRSSARRQEFTGRSIEPGTFEWRTSRVLLDIQGAYNLSKRFSMYINVRNVRGVPEDVHRFGPNTPDEAKFAQRQIWGGALWTVGVRGSF